MMLSDPAMWAYLLDPELLALVVIIGVRYTRWEVELLRMRLLASPVIRSATNAAAVVFVSVIRRTPTRFRAIHRMY